MDGTIVFAIFVAGLILLVALLVATRKTDAGSVPPLEKQDRGATPGRRDFTRQQTSRSGSTRIAAQSQSQPQNQGQPVPRGMRPVSGVHPAAPAQPATGLHPATPAESPQLPEYSNPIGSYQHEAPIGQPQSSPAGSGAGYPEGPIGQMQQLSEQVQQHIPQAAAPIQQVQGYAERAQAANEQRVEVQQLLGEAERMIRQGRGIEAIKMLRDRSGISLADAKNIIDRVRRGMSR